MLFELNRKMRILVSPDKVDDAEAFRLAREINETNRK